MPESITDRPTSAHEHVFLLCKRKRYFYDATAIKEDAVSDHTSGNGFKRKAALSRQNADGTPRGNEDAWVDVGGSRNARNVWSISAHAFAGAHFATMAPALAERCILAGTSELGCCPSCGAPWVRLVRKGAPDEAHRRACGGNADGSYTGRSRKGHAAAGVQDASDVKRRILEGMVEKTTSGWKMTCRCPLRKPVPCTVLDPFAGAGTTALVAGRLHRDAVLIELNAAYATLARQRIERDAGMFAGVYTEDL